MADIFGSFSRGFKSGREMREQSQKNAVDALLQKAQLAELGYDVQTTPRRFGGLFGGGQTIARRPDYVSTKDLERQKLEGEIQDLGFKRDLRQKFGQGQNFGQTDSKNPMIYDPLSGTMKSNPAYLSEKDQVQMDYMKSRMGAGDNLTPGQRMAKDKATADIFETVETNKVKRFGISEAKDAMKRVPQGVVGAIRYGFNKHFDPNDPMLGDFQKIRMIGTDAQLMHTAKTKGAISDKEMALFATAAANDDFISVERLKPVLEKLERFIAAEEAGKLGAYERSYREDPRQWFGQSQERASQVPQGVNPQEYETAKRLGYSDEEIMAYLIQKSGTS